MLAGTQFLKRLIRKFTPEKPVIEYRKQEEKGKMLRKGEVSDGVQGTV